MILCRISKIIAALFFVMPILSCNTINHYPHLYDKSGFESGGRPQEQYGNTTKLPPDYYRQQQYPPQTYPSQTQNYVSQQDPSQYQQMPPQQMPQYQAMPMQQAIPPYEQQAMPYAAQVPSQVPYVSSYQVPGSRFYSNPYSIPPSAYYPNYDIDQYYSPPNSHNAAEYVQQNRIKN